MLQKKYVNQFGVDNEIYPVIDKIKTILFIRYPLPMILNKVFIINDTMKKNQFS